MENSLIKYTDLQTVISNYTHFVVWSGSNEDKINRWLDPIYQYSHDASEFYGISKERECGWYITKKDVLDRLHSTIPQTDDLVFKHDIQKILTEVWDYILDYKEPKGR